MDIWGIGIFLVGLILYFVTKRKYSIFLFISGLGAGIVIAAIWSLLIFDRVFGNF